MDGYDDSTYGERFADVYDDWYGDLTDTDACVDLLERLAGGGAVLELGVGTGRLAVPLAQRGLAVTGVDTSSAMLARLAEKPGGDRVTALLGSMVDPPVGPDARFSVAVVAYNTLFNLTGPGEQERCLAAVARLLAPGGTLVVEAFVPDPLGPDPADAVTTRHLSADRVVLSVSRSLPGTQELLGQYVDITEAGIRLRPWHIRWATPAQLDELAGRAGLVLTGRWADWRGTAFDDSASAHISCYQPPHPDRPRTR